MTEEKYKELESRFKELSDNVTFEYQPSDWTAVDQMLDENFLISSNCTSQ